MPTLRFLARLLVAATLTASAASFATPLASDAGTAGDTFAASEAEKGASPGIFTLQGLDSLTTFAAQFNPTDIQIVKDVAWTRSPTSFSDQPELQFRHGLGRMMSFTLDFDTSATGQDVHSAYVTWLVSLAMIMDPSATAPESKKRPTLVKVAGGAGEITFVGVVESIDTRYTMYLPNGTPVRASCHVTLKEASRATYVKL